MKGDLQKKETKKKKGKKEQNGKERSVVREGKINITYIFNYLTGTTPEVVPDGALLHTLFDPVL